MRADLGDKPFAVAVHIVTHCLQSPLRGREIVRTSLPGYICEPRRIGCNRKSRFATGAAQIGGILQCTRGSIEQRDERHALRQRSRMEESSWQ